MWRREFPASIDPQRAPPGIVEGENVAEPRYLFSVIACGPVHLPSFLHHLRRPSRGFRGRRRFTEPTPSPKTLRGARWGVPKSDQHAAPHFPNAKK